MSEREPFRVPGIVVPFLGAAVGWFVARIPGAVFGAVLGTLIWRGRS